ncbi:MAG: VapC toxin family PIN domain ribonuclease [Limisphaerales bacterium]
MVLVDSSIWIEAARREGDLACKVGLEGLLEAAEAMYCSPVRLEFLGGARAGDRKRLSASMDCIPCKAIDASAWEFAGECAWRLRDKGQIIPWNDILIGSLALRWECRVYARDQHFEIMRDVLGLRLYKPGYGGSYNPRD